MNRGLWSASITLLVIGLVLICAGLILAGIDRSRQLYRGRARARVVDLARREGEGRFRGRYYPVIEFYANDILYKVTLPDGGHQGMWKVGDEITILYDPAHPERFEVADETFRSRLPQILWFSGIFLLILGFVNFIRFVLR